MKNIILKHQTMYSVLSYLADKWQIGVISGITAWTISLTDILFTEDSLRIAGGIGIYLGAFVAFLTAFMKVLDAYDKVIARYRKWRKKDY